MKTAQNLCPSYVPDVPSGHLAEGSCGDHQEPPDEQIPQEGGKSVCDGIGIQVLQVENRYMNKGHPMSHDPRKRNPQNSILMHQVFYKTKLVLMLLVQEDPLDLL